MLRRIVMAIVLTGLLAGGATSGAQAQQPAGAGQQAAGAPGWTFNVAPYMWLPTINATMSYNLPPGLGGRLPTSVSADPGEILAHLTFAGMAAASVQYDRFSLLTDFMYMNLSATNSHFKSIDFYGQQSQPLSASAQTGTGTTLNASIWTLAGGYTLLQGDWGNVDVIAGFRYLDLNVRTNYSLALTVTGPSGNGATFGGIGSVSGSGNLWNGIGGVRGSFRIKDTRLFIPYYFDMGAGGSQLTWQVASGLGYHADWGDMSLTYRYLTFQQGSNYVVRNMSMDGPIFMVNFTF